MNNKEDKLDSIISIALQLGEASINNDENKMTELGNAMFSKDAILQEIVLHENWAEVVFNYMGETRVVKYCK